MKTTLVWLRRDLRLHDHHALSMATKNSEQVHLAFCFDTNILNKLNDKHDRRLSFIIDSLKEMEASLQKQNSSIHILHGDPAIEIPKLALELKAEAVFANRDYEPYAIKRDELVAKKIEFQSFKDHVFFEKHEVLTDQRGIYKVFTPYKNKWLTHFDQTEIPNFKVHLKKIATLKNKKNILEHDWYKALGFFEVKSLLSGGTNCALKKLKAFENKIEDYQASRDFPSLDGTSSLSVYIRHGNISIRDMLRISSKSKTWLSELVWRDFYQMLLSVYPLLETKCFKPEYENIKWLGSEKNFKAWCEGETGFPLVDAAMRHLNKTGMMHNRLRMVVASFLCKILLVDWRKGEKYFAEKLLDFDLAANNGGWQWSASTGADAQPYFRIFNPYTQSEKFDKEGIFIKEHCPELASLNSKTIHRPEGVAPIVHYESQRILCLKMYSVVKTTDKF
jgi:deoxyribodipyrimidine photo-lyase